VDVTRRSVLGSIGVAGAIGSGIGAAAAQSNGIQGVPLHNVRVGLQINAASDPETPWLTMNSSAFDRTFSPFNFNLMRKRNESIVDGATYHIGVNVKAGGTQVDKNETALFWEINTAHEDGDGPIDTMYMSTNFIDRHGERIKIQEMAFNRDNVRDNKFSFISNICNHFSIHDSIPGEPLRVKFDFAPQNNRVSWIGGLQQQHDTNNAEPLMQASTGGPYVSVIKLDSANDVSLGNSGPVNRIRFNAPLHFGTTPKFTMYADGLSPQFGDILTKTNGVEIWGTHDMLRFRNRAAKFNIQMGNNEWVLWDDVAKVKPLHIQSNALENQIFIRSNGYTEFNSNVRFKDGGTIASGREVGLTIGEAPNQKIGFHGATPMARQTVTGSRGGNGALAALLAALANKGSIEDNTTA